MKKYLGVKIVEAEPAWKTFNQIDGTIIYPKSQKPKPWSGCEDGYKVVYEDGYVFWSPKDVFEKAYKEITSDDQIGVLVNTNSADWFIVGSVDKVQPSNKLDNNEEYLKRFCVDNAIKLQYVTSKSELLEAAKEIYNWIKE